MPDSVSPYGESWEISSRPGAESRVRGGSLDGKALAELWDDPFLRSSIFGESAPATDRFPLLFKILDAREDLSLQVHPPESVAAELGGEAKTEAWYVARAAPGAKLHVGLREGVDEVAFREALARGTVADCVHEIPVRAGQHLLLRSGRLHAIGAGLLIYEIQQNSDTTFRVFDWNRVGIDGRPRELHVEESMRCIDFSDVTPSVDGSGGGAVADCEHFRIEEHRPGPGDLLTDVLRGRFAVITVVEGRVGVDGHLFGPGDFFTVPCGGGTGLEMREAGTLLLTTWAD